MKRLVAATWPKEAHVAVKPPVQAALLSTAYQIDAKAGTSIAEMQVESFETAWQAVPLAGAASGAISVEPKDARIVVAEDHLCLITDQTPKCSRASCSASWRWAPKHYCA